MDDTCCWAVTQAEDGGGPAVETEAALAERALGGAYPSRIEGTPDPRSHALRDGHSAQAQAVRTPAVTRLLAVVTGLKGALCRPFRATLPRAHTPPPARESEARRGAGPAGPELRREARGETAEPYSRPAASQLSPRPASGSSFGTAAGGGAGGQPSSRSLACSASRSACSRRSRARSALRPRCRARSPRATAASLRASSRSRRRPCSARAPICSRSRAHSHSGAAAGPGAPPPPGPRRAPPPSSSRRCALFRCRHSTDVPACKPGPRPTCCPHSRQVAQRPAGCPGRAGARWK
ncbi:PREDICTED: transcriptional regulatory protein AlgP-like [Chinchilla lanigera]|uniref:transcriptional regulatory protein AlgP-like n=1 Tax=Chinchilla lanigera TaxID=34839 RepID=UPI000696C3A4|nr:PREDICTED: transcriptional regulatory protein AlgP-like [Chinchilla lanigera]